MGDCSSKESFVRPDHVVVVPAATLCLRVDLTDKNLGDKVLLPPNHCSNHKHHPPRAKLPFEVTSRVGHAHDAPNGNKRVGPRCDYCRKKNVRAATSSTNGSSMPLGGMGAGLMAC